MFLVMHEEGFEPEIRVVNTYNPVRWPEKGQSVYPLRCSIFFKCIMLVFRQVNLFLFRNQD